MILTSQEAQEKQRELIKKKYDKNTSIQAIFQKINDEIKYSTRTNIIIYMNEEPIIYGAVLVFLHELKTLGYKIKFGAIQEYDYINISWG